MLVTGAAHGTMATVSAAGGLACFLILNHAFNNSYYNENEKQGNDDGRDVFRNPCQHMKDSFLIAFSYLTLVVSLVASL